jgi:hypothetical protein
MYNKIFLIKKGKLLLDIPIISFEIFDKDFNPSPIIYSDMLEIVIDYKDNGNGTFLSLNDFGTELILYSLDTVKCIYLSRFRLETTAIYDEKFVIKISFKDVKYTDLFTIPELKNVYRDIQINKILNDV